MKQLVTIALLLVGLLAHAQEAHYEALFEQGNALYEAGKYDSAAVVYEGILAADYRSPKVYYNLGNAYFKANMLPAAILNYERAKRLAPSDPDIEFNLALANERTTDAIEPLPQLFITRFWHNFLFSQSSDAWAVWCLLFFALACAALGLFLAAGKPAGKKAGAAFFVLFLTVSAVMWVSGWQAQKIQTASNQGVVFEPSVTVVSAPDADGTKLFVIHEGTALKVLETRGDWLRIKLRDGQVGWLPSHTVEII